MTKPLLVCYQSGARGDFLASVLLNLSFQNEEIIKVDSSSYKKVHHINDDSVNFANIQSTEIKNYLSVRIRLSNRLDFAKLIYYRKKKQLVSDEYELGHLTMCVNTEMYHRHQDGEFNYIFDFNQIDNLEYICAFYQLCYKRKLNQSMLDLIKSNIELNRIDDKDWKLFYNYFSRETEQFAWPGFIS